jgi:hypothetical protein
VSAALLPIPVGERVGILRGLQAVGGPYVGQYGTVVRHEEFWTGQPDYVVRTDKGEELVYRPYLITPA